ncbi:unnamed protein product, partial [Sphacelaria rigidula]
DDALFVRQGKQAYSEFYALLSDIEGIYHYSIKTNFFECILQQTRDWRFCTLYTGSHQQEDRNCCSRCSAAPLSWHGVQPIVQRLNLGNEAGEWTAVYCVRFPHTQARSPIYFSVIVPRGLTD